MPTLGILGGGQLGRMTALAAYRLGVEVVGYAPEDDTPLAQVCPKVFQGTWDDFDQLKAFAQACDAITLEFENIPTATLEFLAELKPVRPGANVLAMAQDRLDEKAGLQAAGLEVAPHQAVGDLAEFEAARDALGGQGILKTRRFGYDGKGQARFDANTDLAALWAEFATPCIAEGLVDFAWEGSVIVARNEDGDCTAYPLVENRHKDHILDETLAPAPKADEALMAAAEKQAVDLAHSLELQGLLAVEYFITPDKQLIANEVAPRPHNSGLWSQDGTACDQFEQLVRAAMGFALGCTDVVVPVKMYNLLGQAGNSGAFWHRNPRAKLHLYGKRDAKPGRKMGHVNLLLWDYPEEPETFF